MQRVLLLPTRAGIRRLPRAMAVEKTQRNTLICNLWQIRLVFRTDARLRGGNKQISKTKE